MRNSRTKLTGDITVLSKLRSLLPNRLLELNEALVVAELQAEQLLTLRSPATIPIPATVVTDLPRILIEDDPALPRHAASGVSTWDSRRQTWVIFVNPDEPTTRQRLTIIHEYKHIIDYNHPGLRGLWSEIMIHGLHPVEFIAEYFAGCVLVPRTELRRLYLAGVQAVTELARHFDVSARAIKVRLSQVGLGPLRRPIWSSGSSDWSLSCPWADPDCFDASSGLHPAMSIRKVAA